MRKGESIDDEKSERYRKWIGRGFSGIKPGWCRVSLHYVMDDSEVAYITDAVEFIARYGHHFLQEYDFDLETGTWMHKCDCVHLEGFSLDAALQFQGAAPTALSVQERARRYDLFLGEARERAQGLAGPKACDELVLEGELEALKFFSLPRVCCSPQIPQ